MEIRTREVTAALWPDVESLFGARGACGGCWCWYWRLARGESWAAVKGETARRRLRRGIATGAVMGVLAYADAEPVGWCTYGPRPSFARLDRAPSLRCPDADAVWSVPCFFVRRDQRGRGVATALLAAAVAAIRVRGGRIVEGYPVKLPGTAATPTPSPGRGPGALRAGGLRVGGQSRRRGSGTGSVWPANDSERTWIGGVFSSSARATSRVDEWPTKLLYLLELGARRRLHPPRWRPLAPPGAWFDSGHPVQPGRWAIRQARGWPTFTGC